MFYSSLNLQVMHLYKQKHSVPACLSLDNDETRQAPSGSTIILSVFFLMVTYSFYDAHV